MVFYSLMPLGSALAAEVLGVDLAAPLDTDTAEALSAALAAHLVLVFRGQTLSREQYLGAAEALRLPAATLLYGAAISAPAESTDIAHLRAACEELPEAEQDRLGSLPVDEVKAYMREAIGRVAESAFVYRHDWRQGDVLLIDDRGTVHRGHDEGSRTAGRALWRILVEDERPRFG
jgi:alpha-ketoglutarate-dependent taurine dioxygenase